MEDYPTAKKSRRIDDRASISVRPSIPWSPPPAVQATTQLAVGWQVSVAYIYRDRTQPCSVDPRHVGRCTLDADRIRSTGSTNPTRSSGSVHPEFRIHPARSPEVLSGSSITPVGPITTWASRAPPPSQIRHRPGYRSLTPRARHPLLCATPAVCEQVTSPDHRRSWGLARRGDSSQINRGRGIPAGGDNRTHTRTPRHSAPRVPARSVASRPAPGGPQDPSGRGESRRREWRFDLIWVGFVRRRWGCCRGRRRWWRWSGSRWRRGGSGARSRPRSTGPSPTTCFSGSPAASLSSSSSSDPSSAMP